MNDSARKKSPRAPSLGLDEALDRALKVYDKERRHAAPTDVIAQDLGYKSANNGSALSTIASLRSYGLLEKPEDGKLAVSRDVEAYRFAPTDELRNELRIKWLKSPGVFSDLLQHYSSGLPSDASLRFDLIQRGFSPASAESTLLVFKRSVDFAKFFDSRDGQTLADAARESETVEESDTVSTNALERPNEGLGDSRSAPAPQGYDRIPVRLPGGRRAWLEIPTPFYNSDKSRLIAQIGLILTEDDERESPRI